MKKTGTKLISFICITVLLFSMTSCGYLSLPGISGDNYYDVTNNEITINGDKGNTAYASAAGLRSAVSVYCSFEVQTGGNSFWNPTPTVQTYYTTGSGVIYKLEDNGSAFIITNYHVVYNNMSLTGDGISDSIFLYLYGMENQQYAISAYFVGGSSAYDIAVLRVNNSEVLQNAIASGAAAAVTVGNSDDLVPGQHTLAIGNPSSTNLGGISVTEGIVSVDSEYITMTSSDGNGDATFRVIRTDTAINSGNSGGGMYNLDGELVGIVNAKITSSSIENIGYAIPSSVAQAVADNIIDNCYGKETKSVKRALLGITLSATGYSTYYDSEAGIIRKAETISVTQISDGYAATGVLAVGDEIAKITVGDKSRTVTRLHHIIDLMLYAREGHTVIIEYIRNGETKTASFTIEASNITDY